MSGKFDIARASDRHAARGPSLGARAWSQRSRADSNTSCYSHHELRSVPQTPRAHCQFLHEFSSPQPSLSIRTTVHAVYIRRIKRHTKLLCHLLDGFKATCLWFGIRSLTQPRHLNCTESERKVEGEKK